MAMLHSQSQETMEMGFGISRRLSLDTWIPLPVHTPSSNLFSGSFCTPQKAMSPTSTLTLDIASFNGEEEDFTGERACETPKSTQHRIPDVDVDLCPPAPKKPRGMRRLVFTCSTECENPNVRQDLGLSPSYLF